MKEEEDTLMDDTLYLQLHKLSSINSEQLEDLLCTLWNTRKTGLASSDHQKSHFQSLLNLPSPSQLDPVLACLRSLIRKWVHENFTADEFSKFLPPDLPLHLHTNLLLLLQKYQSQWKHEIAVVQQVNASVPPFFMSPGITDSLNDHVPLQFGASNPILSATASELTPMTCHNLETPNLASFNMQGILPRLKSTSWTMENSKSGSANKVAIINLKLQDYSKSGLDEIEVKFQLTRDTLEAMLRSLTYIREQLSSMAGTASEPSQKKQKQSDNAV